MHRFFETIKKLKSYFDQYWWSNIQDSKYCFCDKDGNVILPESYFAYNPVRHFIMCLRYDLKNLDECEIENSIFEGENFNLIEINKLCRKYKIMTSWSVQVRVHDKYVYHYDISAKPGNNKRRDVKCCFCNSKIKGYGNSTWPIYYNEDGENNRCCNKCNEKYVIAARNDSSLIMGFRHKFGIDYTKY